MRRLVLLIPILLPLVLFALAPQPIKALYQKVSGSISSIARDRELKFENVEPALALQIRKSLPHESSNFWWRTNLQGLEASVLRVSGVQSATVQPCSFWSLSCYSLKIDQRSAALKTEIAGVTWSVSEDGALLRPVLGAAKNLADIPLVNGQHFSDLAPQDLKATLASVAHALRVLNVKTSLVVDKVQLRKNGDMLLTGTSLPFELLLSLKISQDIPSLEQQSERIVKLLASPKFDKYGISRIDLSYRNLALVSRKTSEVEVVS